MRKLIILTPFLLAGCAASGAQITSFEECIAAGYPAMESYPRQCRAGDVTFTEIVDEPLNPDAE